MLEVRLPSRRDAEAGLGVEGSRCRGLKGANRHLDPAPSIPRSLDPLIPLLRGYPLSTRNIRHSLHAANGLHDLLEVGEVLDLH
jgi:hypothetical protein